MSDSTQTLPRTTMPQATKAPTPRKLFVNIPVRDLTAALDFFGKLGFAYNPQFADETAACMLVGEDAYFMLLTHEKFQGFTKRPMALPANQTPAMFALSCGTREEVDRLHATALANGGRPAGDPQDYGFMYQQSFLDLDGHHWELFYMDPAFVQG